MPDINAIVGLLNEQYVQCVPPEWASALMRQEPPRSVCSCRIIDESTFEAVCNTTNKSVRFTIKDTSDLRKDIIGQNVADKLRKLSKEESA